MKKFTITIPFLVLTIALFSQTSVPQLVNFQAVARNADNSLIANSTIELKLTIRQGSAIGAALYCSVYASVPTNQNGSFSIQLNRGTFALACNSAPGVTFDQIDWSTGNKWVQIEYRPNTAAGFTDLGAIELASVPYAFAAKTAERVKSIPYVRAPCNSGWISSSKTNEWLSHSSFELTVPESGTYLLNATMGVYGASYNSNARVINIVNSQQLFGFAVGAGSASNFGSKSEIVNLTAGQALRFEVNNVNAGLWNYGAGSSFNIVRLSD